nr:unnamed protein product [Callosobruchus chinensis]
MQSLEGQFDSLVTRP